MYKKILFLLVFSVLFSSMNFVSGYGGDKKDKIKKLIDNMRVKYKFLEKDLNKLEKALEEE